MQLNGFGLATLGDVISETEVPVYTNFISILMALSDPRVSLVIPENSVNLQQEDNKVVVQLQEPQVDLKLAPQIHVNLEVV